MSWPKFSTLHLAVVALVAVGLVMSTLVAAQETTPDSQLVETQASAEGEPTPLEGPPPPDADGELAPSLSFLGPDGELAPVGFLGPDGEFILVEGFIDPDGEFILVEGFIDPDSELVSRLGFLGPDGAFILVGELPTSEGELPMPPAAAEAPPFADFAPIGGQTPSPEVPQFATPPESDQAGLPISPTLDIAAIETPTITLTPTMTLSPTPTPSPTITPTLTATPSATTTPSPTITPSVTPTQSPTKIPTSTKTPPPTQPPTATSTPFPDGSGSISASPSTFPASSTANTITFTYIATGSISSGEVVITVPSTWSAPSLTSAAAGYTTASSGTASVSGQTITVSGLTMSAASTLIITYGSRALDGPGATAPPTGSISNWQAQQRSTASGNLTSLSSLPSITVYAANGSGTLTASTSAVSVNTVGHTVTFTYTAAAGGMNAGQVDLIVPNSWSAPSATAGSAGYVTASTGALSVSGTTISITNIILSSSGTFTLVYGSKSGTPAGTGATAPSTAGSYSWEAKQASSSTATLASLSAGSPSITIYNDAVGTLSTTTPSFTAASTGNTVVLIYTADADGMVLGEVDVTVPAGWSTPLVTPATSAGYVTASTGSVLMDGRKVKVKDVTLGGGGVLTITYGATSGGGLGATAPSASSVAWQAQQKSTTSGTPANITSPTITVT